MVAQPSSSRKLRGQGCGGSGVAFPPAPLAQFNPWLTKDWHKEVSPPCPTVFLVFPATRKPPSAAGWGSSSVGSHLLQVLSWGLLEILGPQCCLEMSKHALKCLLSK